MTEQEANEYLKDNEEEIFIDKKYGKAVYAAVINDPRNPFEYTIEIGFKIKPTYVVDKFLSTKKHSELSRLGISENTISKLEKMTEEIIKNRDIFLEGDYKFGLDEDEIQSLKLDPLPINGLSKEDLMIIGFSEEVSGKLKDEKFISRHSDDIELLCCGNSGELYKNRHDYLEGGISISSFKDLQYSGTLGCLLRIKEDRSIFALTNAHVLRGGVRGHKNYVAHPSLSDSNSNSIPIGNVHWLLQNDIIDAALIRIDSLLEPGEFSRCANIQFLSPIEAARGMAVEKCGRSTGYSEGIVRSTNATLYYFSKPLNKHFFYRNQIMTTCMANGGDSGSPLVSKSGNVVGLIFAKTKNHTATFSNHFENIFNQNVKNYDLKKITFKEFINFKNK